MIATSKFLGCPIPISIPTHTVYLNNGYMYIQAYSTGQRHEHLQGQGACAAQQPSGLGAHEAQRPSGQGACAAVRPAARDDWLARCAWGGEGILCALTYRRTERNAGGFLVLGCCELHLHRAQASPSWTKVSEKATSSPWVWTPWTQVLACCTQVPSPLQVWASTMTQVSPFPLAPVPPEGSPSSSPWWNPKP